MVGRSFNTFTDAAKAKKITNFRLKKDKIMKSILGASATST